MRTIFQVLLLTILIPQFSFAQPDRWQQRADYKMDIDMNVVTNQFEGKQTITYTNNSPDTLHKVFYHLYFNAFQPNSMMDVRSRTIEDPDRRVGDRIFHLSEEEIGFQKVLSLKQDRKKVDYSVSGTILEVKLAKPILPGTSSTFVMEFLGQVPLQIRRSGRDNAEGVRYTMTQWYPKMAQYDYEGWHSNPYIGREFHGIWGNFEVNITIDSSYVVGGTGMLQNPDKIGHGYADPSTVKRKRGDKLTWNFLAENVHDFAWAADPKFKHTMTKMDNGTELHFFFIPSEKTQLWETELPAYTVKIFEQMNQIVGEYPWPQYSVIQGGDGGMEYPMATMITGHRNLRSLVGVTAHEAIHSWFQSVLATNESLYEWMDEGFTNYTQDLLNLEIPGDNSVPHLGSYMSYVRLVESGKAEPLTTHADHYRTNFAYSVNAYSKGAMVLHNLRYILGEEEFFKAFRKYYATWKFKHPNPTDFKRVFEKSSGLELDWFFEHFTFTLNTIDYSINKVVGDENGTVVGLMRVGDMPMPIDIMVLKTNGEKMLFTIPLRIMRGAKTADLAYEMAPIVMEEWPWTNPTYDLKLDVPFSEIEAIMIDPSNRMSDINRGNNQFPFE